MTVPGQRRAIALARQSRTEEAIARFTEAVHARPAWAEAHYNLGLALMEKGDIPGAITHLSEAVRLKPDFADARSNLHLAQARLPGASRPQ